MAQGYSAELVGVLDSSLTVPSKTDGRSVNAKVRVFSATLDLASSAVKHVNGDTNVLFRIPAGYKALYGVLLASATMGATATIAIGTAASAAKYRAAAVFTAADTPTLFMKSSAGDDDPLTTYEDVIMTWGAADGPASGVLQVFMFCSAR